MHGVTQTTSSRVFPTDGRAAAGRRGTGLRAFLFDSVGQRLTAAVTLAVALGIGGAILFHSRQQESEILAANERTLRQVAESALRGLETIMLGGYADIAPYYAERLRDVRDVDDFRFLRTDGSEAFLDNATVAAINARFGSEAFPVKSVERHVQVLPPEAAPLREAVAARRTVTYYETDEAGTRHITILTPVVLDDRCRVCHVGEADVNAVVKLTTSLGRVEADIRRTWQSAVMVLVVSISLIVVAAYLLVRRSIVRPIATVSAAMARVADGHLEQTVPVLGRSELGRMAGSFNEMAAQLLRTYEGLQNEQNKLTTIIQAAIEGIVVTDGAGTVVLVNPAAERLLGKSFLEIMRGGFANLIDDPERMRAWLANGTAAEDVTYKGRVLNIQVARIADETGADLGASALLRDITEERRMEQRLRSLSTTDALTGLWNRRHLDQALALEFERARRYGLELSLLLFDIDHFKAFNDTYGHDVGDKVLKAVAEQVAATVRQVDIACRYGGEEFVVILPETDAEGACGMAERVRAAVAATDVDGLRVTVTIGVAALAGSAAATAAELVEAADKALYRGKKDGRNRVVRAGGAAA